MNIQFLYKIDITKNVIKLTLRPPTIKNKYLNGDKF